MFILLGVIKFGNIKKRLILNFNLYLLMRRLFYLLILFILGAGCVTMKAISYYPQGEFSPTDPAEVIIIHGVPPRKHIVIGEVTVSSASFNEEELKDKVSEIGGDGVILKVKRMNRKEIIRPGTSEITVTSDGRIVTHRQPVVRTYSDSRATGKIIKFTD